MAVLLTLALVLPFQAHSAAELDDWYASWLAAPAESSELLMALMDMRARHPWYFQPGKEVMPSDSATGATVSTPPAQTPWPGDWVALVSTYFRPEDVQAALNVVDCESGFSLTAKNPSSSAWGPWQFLRDTWDRMVAPHTGSPSYDSGAPTDPVWSTINAAWLWYNVGPSQWVCW